MKKVLTVPVLVILVVMFSIGTASAEWLYATNGDTFVHVTTDRNSDTLGVFMKGEKIWVYDHIYTPDGRNWCKVSFLGETGYISDRYSGYNVPDESLYNDVNKNAGSDGHYDEDPDYDDESEYYDDYYDDYYYTFDDQVDFQFVANKDVNIYSWYEGGEVVGTLRRGQSAYGSMIFTCADSNETFLEAYSPEQGEYVYIPTRDLHIDEGNFPRLSRYMEVSGGTVNVRSGPDINSESLRIIERGTILDVDFFVCVFDEEYRIWAYCRDPYGETLGYVSCRYLRPEQ